MAVYYCNEDKCLKDNYANTFLPTFHYLGVPNEKLVGLRRKVRIYYLRVYSEADAHDVCSHVEISSLKEYAL